MNGSACTAYCAQKNYVYAGTEYGDECYCGNMLGAPSSLQNDTKCSMPCAGNSSEACGGTSRSMILGRLTLTKRCIAANMLTVYFANKDVPKGPSVNPGPANWTSYGCWQDSGNPRTLSHSMGDIPFSNMTVALCTSDCASNGYTLAGVEYSGECYCVWSRADIENKVHYLTCDRTTGSRRLQRMHRSMIATWLAMATPLNSVVLEID